VHILKNEGTAAQNQVVVANAAFAIRVAAPETDFAECRARAQESLASGAAYRVFKQLAEKGEK
jgi:anthranilate phosphoribosyltransferase